MGVQVIPQAIAIVILIRERQVGAIIEIHPVREKDIIASSVDFPTLPAPAG